MFPGEKKEKVERKEKRVPGKKKWSTAVVNIMSHTELLLQFVPLEIAYGFVACFLFPQVDMLSEINIAPRILTNFTGVMPPQFKKDLDSYLKTRSPVTFLSDLRSNLQVSGCFLRMLNLKSVGQTMI